MREAERDGIFDLPTVPGLAPDRIKSGGHDRHEPVYVVIHACFASGNFASGSRP